MPTPATVRPMMAADVEPLATALAFPVDWIGRRWKECLSSEREVFVAARNGEPVGCVSIDAKNEIPGLLHLFALDVGEPHRNSGIGTSLVEHIERTAGKRGSSGVYLDVDAGNTHAIRLYERLGYQREGGIFSARWTRYDAAGNASEEVADNMQRMTKRFPT